VLEETTPNAYTSVCDKRVSPWVETIADAGLPGLTGSSLHVDSEGHFREEVVYQIEEDTLRFPEDGFYESTQEEYEAEGDFILEEGESSYRSVVPFGN
jgi:hypothetical protein